MSSTSARWAVHLTECVGRACANVTVDGQDKTAVIFLQMVVVKTSAWKRTKRHASTDAQATGLAMEVCATAILAGQAYLVICLLTALALVGQMGSVSPDPVYVQLAFSGPIAVTNFVPTVASATDHAIMERAPVQKVGLAAYATAD